MGVWIPGIVWLVKKPPTPLANGQHNALAIKRQRGLVFLGGQVFDKDWIALVRTECSSVSYC